MGGRAAANRGFKSDFKKNTQGRGRIHCVLQYETMSEMYRVTPFSETTSIQKYSMKNFFWMANHFHYIEYFSKLLHIVYNKMQFSSKIVLLES